MPIQSEMTSSSKQIKNIAKHSYELTDKRDKLQYAYTIREVQVVRQINNLAKRFGRPEVRNDVIKQQDKEYC